MQIFIRSKLLKKPSRKVVRQIENVFFGKKQDIEEENVSLKPAPDDQQEDFFVEITYFAGESVPSSSSLKELGHGAARLLRKTYPSLSVVCEVNAFVLKKVRVAKQ